MHFPRCTVARLLLAISVTLLGAAVGFAGSPKKASTPSLKAAGSALAASQSQCFIENKGQWDSRAQFLAQSGGIDSWITDEGVVYDFHKFIPAQQLQPSTLNPLRSKNKGTRIGQVVKMSFANARPAQITATGELRGKLNYFIGNDRSQWATDVRRFSEAKSQEIYDGIAVRYYVESGAPRYDLIVKPGADPSQVQMKLEGADGARVLPNGNLEIRTQLGTVEERGLTAYQETGNGKTRVPCRMTMDGNTLRFDAGGYDVTKPLIIDPLLFSTFLGGNTDDQCNAVALDSADNVAVAGLTTSTNFPTTTGAYQSHLPGQGCGFVAKLSSDGRFLLFGTYLGGNSVQFGRVQRHRAGRE